MRRIIFFSIAGLVILGQFGRVELGYFGALYFHDIAFTLLGINILWKFRSSVMTWILRSQMFYSISLFSVWVMISSIIAFHRDFTGLLIAVLYLSRFLLYLSFGLITGWMSEQRELSRRELIGWLSSIPLGLLCLGFVQYIFYPDTRSLALLGWDDHYYRLISTIFDPGFTGILLVIGSLVFIHWALQFRRLGFWLAYVALCLGILLTYSRASYLAWMLGMIIYVWRLKKYWLCVWIPLFLGTMLILPRPGGEGVRLERTASAIARVESVSGAFEQMNVFQFLTGKGWYWKKILQPTSMLSGIQVPNHSSAAENSYVFLLSSVGVIGLGLWGWMGSSCLRKSSGDALVWSTTAAIALHAFFTNTWMYGFVILYYGVIMVYSAPQSHLSSRQQQH